MRKTLLQYAALFVFLLGSAFTVLNVGIVLCGAADRTTQLDVPAMATINSKNPRLMRLVNRHMEAVSLAQLHPETYAKGKTFKITRMVVTGELVYPGNVLGLSEMFYEIDKNVFIADMWVDTNLPKVDVLWEDPRNVRARAEEREKEAAQPSLPYTKSNDLPVKK